MENFFNGEITQDLNTFTNYNMSCAKDIYIDINNPKTVRFADPYKVSIWFEKDGMSVIKEVEGKDWATVMKSILSFVEEKEIQKFNLFRKQVDQKTLFYKKYLFGKKVNQKYFL